MVEPKNNFLKQVLEKCRQTFGYVALFSLFINAAMLIIPLYMLQIFDRVIASHSVDTLIFLSIIATLGLMLYGLLEIVRSKIMIIFSHWMDKHLSPAVLQRSPDYILQGNGSPTQFLKDVTEVRQFLGGHGILTLMDAPWVPIYLLVIFMLHPLLGVIALVGAVILFVLAFFNERWTRTLLNEANTRYIRNQWYIGTVLNNAETIQAMGLLPHIMAQWNKKNELITYFQSSASQRASLIAAVSKFFRLFLQLVMLGVGAYLVVTNVLTGGAMIAGSILLSRALAPVEQSIVSWQQSVHAKQAYKRLEEYFNLPLLRPKTIALPKPSGYLEVKELSYLAPGSQKPLLQNISFALEPGDLLVVVGPSAAGKTTLARLLVGAWKATSGAVRLDGASVYDWTREQIGQYIGYLPQNVQLFPGTIKNNIARLAPDPKDADIIGAAQAAYAHDMILRLAQGYETELTDRSNVLSGGQQQRIGLARALYGQPRLLVLDEPNANLDKAGEDALLSILQVQKSLGITSVVITHRTSILQLATKILVLQNGKIAMFGEKEKVLAAL